MAKGTFYHYFASKDAMLEELVRRFGDTLFDHLSAAVRDALREARFRPGLLGRVRVPQLVQQAFRFGYDGP